MWPNIGVFLKKNICMLEVSFSSETVTAVMMPYNVIKAKILSPNNNTDFYIVTESYSKLHWHRFYS